MTVTLELEAALKEEAARQGVAPEGLSEQATVQALIAGLKTQRIPQSLDEIKPRRLPPPGKTVWDMIVEQWPGDETAEEINKALEELS